MDCNRCIDAKENATSAFYRSPRCDHALYARRRKFPEAIRFAALAGFDCIETDVRWTSDSVLWRPRCHLARTFTYNDGKARTQ